MDRAKFTEEAYTSSGISKSLFFKEHVVSLMGVTQSELLRCQNHKKTKC